jgi:hypothetical protein
MTIVESVLSDHFNVRWYHNDLRGWQTSEYRSRICRTEEIVTHQKTRLSLKFHDGPVWSGEGEGIDFGDTCRKANSFQRGSGKGILAYVFQFRVARKLDFTEVSAVLKGTFINDCQRRPRSSSPQGKKQNQRHYPQSREQWTEFGLCWVFPNNAQYFENARRSSQSLRSLEQ